MFMDDGCPHVISPRLPLSLAKNPAAVALGRLGGGWYERACLELGNR